MGIFPTLHPHRNFPFPVVAAYLNLLFHFSVGHIAVGMITASYIICCQKCQTAGGPHSSCDPLLWGPRICTSSLKRSTINPGHGGESHRPVLSTSMITEQIALFELHIFKPQLVLWLRKGRQTEIINSRKEAGFS